MAKAKTSYKLHYLTGGVIPFTNKRLVDKAYRHADKIAYVYVWITKDDKIIKSNTTLREVTR